MRVIVTGGRDYADIATVRREIVRIGMEDMHAVIVHGAAPGADTIARFCAEDLGLATEAHPVDWDRCSPNCRPEHRRSMPTRPGGRARRWGSYCPTAGHRRNQEMVDAGADLVLAFPGGRGTADCVRRARAAGIVVREVS